MHTSKDPLHGVTLEALLTDLVARYGWDELARHIKINCFKSDPSIKSSLKFLRRTPWARKEVENFISILWKGSSTNPPTLARGPTGRRSNAYQVTACSLTPLRSAPGALPVMRLKARLKAASEL